MQTVLSLRLNAFLNWTTNLLTSSSPICGSFVFTIATAAAKMGENGRDEDCAFMMLLQNRPRPRTKFSANSSGTMDLMFATLTLLMRPLMDFFNASHAIRWYSFDVLSVI
jgi:hypothetical protein